MTLAQAIKDKRTEIQRIAAEHGVTSLRIFGSVAHGQEHPGSDLDMLVEIGPTVSPWFPAGLIIDLEQLLGCRVDVVTERALHPTLREAVLREARPR